MTKKELTDPVAILGLLLPSPVRLITTVGEDGTPNIFAHSFMCQAAMEPFTVAMALRPQRYSYWLIQMIPEFVINVPTVEMLDQVWVCGQTTGLKVHKFEKTGLTPIPARTVRPPLIQECVAHLECQVRQQVAVGSHYLLLAEVVAASVNEEVYNWAPPRGFMLDKMKPLLFLQDRPFRFSTAERRIEPPDLDL